MIYFLQRPEGGPIKIGTAIAVSRRLKDLNRLKAIEAETGARTSTVVTTFN